MSKWIKIKHKTLKVLARHVWENFRARTEDDAFFRARMMNYMNADLDNDLNYVKVNIQNGVFVSDILDNRFAIVLFGKDWQNQIKEMVVEDDYLKFLYNWAKNNNFRV